METIRPVESERALRLIVVEERVLDELDFTMEDAFTPAAAPEKRSRASPGGVMVRLLAGPAAVVAASTATTSLWILIAGSGTARASTGSALWLMSASILAAACGATTLGPRRPVAQRWSGVLAGATAVPAAPGGLELFTAAPGHPELFPVLALPFLICAVTVLLIERQEHTDDRALR